MVNSKIMKENPRVSRTYKKARESRSLKEAWEPCNKKLLSIVI